jgi:hypothetical protein
LQADYTVGLWHGEDVYLQGIVRTKLTRNMAATVEQVNDEITKALEECIPSAGEGMLLALREVVLVSNKRSRMGQNFRSANYAPHNLSYYQSDFCGRYSMYAAVLLSFVGEIY